MQKVNITSLIQLMHQQEICKQFIADTHLEMAQGIPKSLSNELKLLLNRSELKSKKSKVVAFPVNKIKLACTQLMAASGRTIGDWFVQPIVFSGSGFVVDIRKVLGSQNEVDVYIHPNGSDGSLIEETLLPFKDKSLKIRMYVNGNELLSADIYVDESGHAAEGTGVLKSVLSDDLHGELSIEVNEIK